MNSKLENILNLIDKFKEVIFNHIYRKGNSEADQMANKIMDGENVLELANVLDNVAYH